VQLGGWHLHPFADKEEIAGPRTQRKAVLVQTNGVHIEILHSPALYTSAQLEHAWRIAELLNRGKLTLTEPPAMQDEETDR
jgi:hypothetical protein